MKKIIKLTEQDLEKIIKKVLNEQSKFTIPTYSPLNPNASKENINPKNLKLGDGGRNNPKQINDVKELQSKLFKLGFLKTKSMTPTGYFGSLTKAALKRYESKNSLKAEPKQEKYTCVGISKEECSKISSKQDTIISTGDDKRCAAYMIKCLSTYNEELVKRKSNAWFAFQNMKAKGVEKYNMFGTDDIKWNEIYTNLVKNKVSPQICDCYKDDHMDGKCKGNIPQIVTNSYPQRTSFNYKNLQLGDIVGMYYNASTNKGQAFCQRIKLQGLQNDGNVKVKGKFTFNTHVGFVTAIKDGMPIILHNIGNETQGLHHATPANKLLSKNDAMIVWVVSDNEVSKNINSIK
jgi:peptidoglycan hydrolase-like protein with peptidoglycan-binding domain